MTGDVQCNVESGHESAECSDNDHAAGSAFRSAHCFSRHTSQLPPSYSATDTTEFTVPDSASSADGWSALATFGLWRHWHG